MNPLNSVSYFFNLRLLLVSSHIRVVSLSPSAVPNKLLHTYLLSPTRATCPAHLILLELKAQMVSTEDIHEAPYDSVHEASYNAVHEAPYNAVHEAPYNAVHEAPYNAVHEASYNAVHEASYNAVHEAPYNAVHEAPYNAVHEAPYNAILSNPSLNSSL